jgi:hypothetical protein
MYLDEYGDPSEDMINDWNIHNDHQDDGEYDEAMEELICDDCENTYVDYPVNNLCRRCQDEYDRRNPHPLDIAEREELEDRSAGLEQPWWAYR